jgi:hypothetical protein
MTQEAGAFDDLLRGPSGRRPSTRSEFNVAALVTKAIALLDRAPPTLAEQVAAYLALHTCARCEHQADAARAAGEVPPPVQLAESWYSSTGRRYHAATCRDCTDFEWAQMWQRRHDLASGKGEGAKLNIGEQRRLTVLAEKRQASGRRVPINWPGQNA